jgi:hypothetical protein
MLHKLVALFLRHRYATLRVETLITNAVKIHNYFA